MSTERAGGRTWLRRAALVAAVGGLLAFAVLTAPGPRQSEAAPRFSLTGTAIGVELCPQVLCGAATFVGYFGGDVDGRRGSGWWMIAARHDALPEAGESAAITGGRWALSLVGARTTGAVVDGSIRNNGDDTFTIAIALAAAAPAGASLSFSGLLDHRRFPPTARGTITGG